MLLHFSKTRSRETRGESILELGPTTPTYQNPININSQPVLCKAHVIFGFQCLPYRTPIGLPSQFFQFFEEPVYRKS